MSEGAIKGRRIPSLIIINMRNNKKEKNRMSDGENEVEKLIENSYESYRSPSGDLEQESTKSATPHSKAEAS